MTCSMPSAGSPECTRWSGYEIRARAPSGAGGVRARRHQGSLGLREAHRRTASRLRRVPLAKPGAGLAGRVRISPRQRARGALRESEMMARQIVQTDKAPKAIGPYSQAVVSGDLVFTSGQIALDPVTQQLVTGDVRVQTERVMENLAAVLAAAGSSFDKVVKATIFVIALNDFAIVNEIYGKRFPQGPPARSTVQVAALPKGARVEIELIARKG